MDGYTAAAALFVARNANRDELRRAFRARAKELHPDTNPHGSESAFIQLREAFDHLMATASEAAPSPSATQRQTAARFEVPTATPRPISVDLSDTQKHRPRFSTDHRPIDPEGDARGRRFADHLAAAMTTL